MPPSLLWLLLSLCAGDYTTFTPRYSADPSPLVVGDRLYVYTTHDEVGATSFAMQDYNVFSTTDGVNWRDDGIAFSPVHNTTWAKNAWAQQVIWHAPLQRFIMYFPGMGNPSVGVAVATDPRGPFVDYALEAIAPGEDPTVFVDDDGTPILCTATSTPYNMPWCGVLNQDMKSWRVPPSQLHINGLSPGDFFEAPWLFKYDGVYYLSFMEDYSFGSSAGAPFGWSLGYATNASPNPLGNYTYRGPLLWANPLNCDNARACGDGLGFVGGNTHHGFALDFPTGSGKHWLLYHTRNLAVEKGQVTFSQRNVAMDRVYFFNNESTATVGAGRSGVRGGIVTPVASTPTGWVQQLHWVDPYQVQPAASFAAGAGTSLFLGTQPAVDCDPLGGQWRYLWNASSGDAMRVRGVDFGSGGSGGSVSSSSSGSSSMDSPTSSTTLFFTARVATPNGGGVLEVYMDGVPGGGGGGGGGVLIASAPVPNTGGWEVFTNITTPIQPVAVVGVHDLYFVFHNTAHGGGGGQLSTFNFASWGFAMKGVERRGVGMVPPLPPKKSPPPPLYTSPRA